MALSLKNAITSKHFAGGKNLQSSDTDGLGQTIRDLLALEAQKRFHERNMVNFTDSSGGTAGMVFTTVFATRAYTIVFAAATYGAGRLFETGDGPFQFTTANTLPDGLSLATDYWLRRYSDNEYSVHTTKLGALDDNIVTARITNTDNGTGEHQMQCAGSAIALSADDNSSVNTSVTAATFDTSIDSWYTAAATLCARANLMTTILGAGTLVVGQGTSGGATIASVDIDVATNSSDTTGTTYASGKTALDEIFDSEQTLIRAIDTCRVAVGLGKVPRSRTMLGDPSTTTLTASATDGVTTTASTITSSISHANVEIILNNLRDNIAFYAAQLDECYDRDSEYLVTLGPVLETGLGAASTEFINSPVSGRIRKIQSIVTVVIGAGDAVFTVEIDGSAVDGATLTIAGTAAVGVHDQDTVADTQTATPTTPNVATGNFVSEGQDIEIVGAGGSASGECVLFVDIAPTGEDRPYMTAFRG